MSDTFIRGIAAALLLGATTTAGAQGIALTHAGTIYADSQGQALNRPEGVACGSGALLIADTGNGRVLTMATEGDAVRNVTAVKLPEVPYPTRVVSAKDGTLLVLDRKKKRVARIAKGNFTGYLDVPGEPSGSVVVAAFALDGAGNVYLLDIAKNAVRVVDAAGAASRTIALPDAREAMIVDVAADEAGALYAVDSLGRKVWVAPAGATALKPLSKSLKDELSFPASIAVNKGRIYVVDQNGNGIVVLGQDGAFVGRRLSLGWAEGQVRYPGQICFEGDRIYIADRQNNRVQSFSAP